jgi:DNA-binding MarR family transcriptional regulator
MFVHELNRALFMDQEKPLGVEIRLTNNMIKAYIDQTLQAKLEEPLTGIEGMVLGYVFKAEGQTVTSTELLAKSKGAKATISQTLKGLVKKGYLKMEPSSQDKRKKMITLTEKGLKVEKEFKEIFKGITQQVKNGITPEEEQTVRNVLAKIRTNVGNKED